MKTLFTVCISLWMYTSSFSQNNMSSTAKDFQAFHIDQLMEEVKESGRPWLAFMREQNVLTGIYHLKKGTVDGQRPHDTDEVYYIISGKSKFMAGDEESEVSPGSILFVRAEVDHRFFDIEEDLIVLVFFDQ